jgi:hypothetical protein
LGQRAYARQSQHGNTEALTVVQQVETAPFFLPSVSGQLTGVLVCYGRSVVHGEWDRMRTGTLAATLDPWGIELFRTLSAGKDGVSAESRTAHLPPLVVEGLLLRVSVVAAGVTPRSHHVDAR